MKNIILKVNRLEVYRGPAMTGTVVGTDNRMVGFDFNENNSGVRVSAEESIFLMRLPRDRRIVGGKTFTVRLVRRQK